MRLRVARQHWEAVLRLTRPSFAEGVRRAPEMACILLITANGCEERPALLVNEVLDPHVGDLIDRGTGSVTLSSGYMRRALFEVRERRLAGFITVHTHPAADESVQFSPFDDANDPPLMANLTDLFPAGIFGSVVLGRRSAAGRLWRRGAVQSFDRLVIVGERLEYLRLDGASTAPAIAPAKIFDRSLSLTGSGALADLAGSRIGVVGVSGTGSLIAELLTRAGAGELELFEFDNADETNLGRVLHLRVEDAKSGVNKASRIADAVASFGIGTKLSVASGGDIRDAEVAARLAGCDLIIGCVDRDWPRLIMSEVAYQHLVPLIDLGTDIGAAAEGVQSLDARVSIVGPGRPCLLCSRVVSQERVRMESYSDEERRRVRSLGYSRDLELATPAVMELNMRAASLAGLIVRHLFQPFLLEPLPHAICESVTTFSAKAKEYAMKTDCVVCGTTSRLGAGLTWGLSTRPTASVRA
jgi:hypothetical protein